jgi:diaminopimelate decarboxylase
MKILDALDTPKLVYNTSIIEKNINIFTTALNNNVDAYYSVKANNNQQQLLAQLQQPLQQHQIVH